MSLRRWKMWSALSLVVTLAGVVGCSGEGGASEGAESADGVAQAPLTDEAQADDEGPAGPHARRHHGPGGPEFLLMASLRDLDLTDAQRATIQGAIDKLPQGPQARPKDAAPFKALAEGVRAGKVDASAVTAKLGAPPDFEERRAALAGALQTLHATLTKEQRSALVASIQKRMDEHGPKGERGEHGPKGERGMRGGMPMGPLGFLLRDLDLKDTQREAIARALEAQKPSEADHEAMKQRFEAMRGEMRARLQTFTADSFDAKAFLTPPAGDKGPGKMNPMEHMVKELAVVVPLLDAAQREKLATLIEQGPPAGMHPPMGRPGMRGADAPAR